MISRRSFLQSIIAAVACAAIPLGLKEPLKASIFTEADSIGEWQTHVLKRNAIGSGSGGTLFGLMSRLKSDDTEGMGFNWWEKQ